MRPPEARIIFSFQSLLKPAVYQKYFLPLYGVSHVFLGGVFNFFLNFGDFSWVGGGTLPRNSYDPSQDL